MRRRAELLYPKLLFSCADFPGNTGQIARAEQGGRSCFAKRMECVELAPAVRCVARFDSGSKLHALHTLRAVWFRLRRAEDRRALPSAGFEAVCSRGLILRRWFHLASFCAFNLDTGHSNPSLRRPTQAVILAGGRGERLRPFTDIRPKPMIEIHVKPFLDYLITMLRS